MPQGHTPDIVTSGTPAEGREVRSVESREVVGIRLSPKVVPAVATSDDVATERYTPLMVASLREDIRGVQELLARGADINVTGKDGDTALHIAARSKNKDLVAALLKGNPDVHIKNNNINFNGVILGDNIESFNKVFGEPVETGTNEGATDKTNIYKYNNIKIGVRYEIETEDTTMVFLMKE